MGGWAGWKDPGSVGPGENGRKINALGDWERLSGNIFQACRHGRTLPNCQYVNHHQLSGNPVKDNGIL